MIIMKAIYLSDELHAQLRLTAARRRQPLKAVVAALLERALAAEEGRDVSTRELSALAARGGSFDFLLDEGEDLYTAMDGEPIE
jgi:plasmid stability protein